jgi:hypothetical protein
MRHCRNIPRVGILGFRHRDYEERSSMATHKTHDEHPQPPGRSAAGSVEPEVLAHRAYELFEERGREEGRELDDWLRAEHELKKSNHDNASE